MIYIKERGGTFYVSFDGVGFGTSKLVATRMGGEIERFLSTCKKTIDLRFGGYARLSEDFAEAFVKKINWQKHDGRIIHRQMHVFDGWKLGAALQAINAFPE